MFDVRRIRVEGDVTRNSVNQLIARATRCRQASPATSSRSTWARRQRAFEAVPWVRHAVGEPRVAEPAERASWRSTAPRRLWSMDEGSDQLVNTFGEVLPTRREADDARHELPTLDGPRGQRRRSCCRAYRRLQPGLRTAWS